MYKRRKFILSLLQIFGGELEKIRLQKLLFLSTLQQEKPFYDFVPYKFGCYSFQANQDLNTMVKYNLVESSEIKWRFKTNDSLLMRLDEEDREILRSLYIRYKGLSQKELVKHVYEQHPYYAIKSEMAPKLLSDNSYEKIKEAIPVKTGRRIFTIGYEGKSIEKYANQLLKEDVKILCDIRKNPLSMKYGFSKNQLKNVMENLGIKYIHIPELGIESSKRKELNSMTDYENLFFDYNENVLPQKENELRRIAELLQHNNRIALTCFEADENCCHRLHTANALYLLLEKKISLKHL